MCINPENGLIALFSSNLLCINASISEFRVVFEQAWMDDCDVYLRNLRIHSYAIVLYKGTLSERKHADFCGRAG